MTVPKRSWIALTCGVLLAGGIAVSGQPPQTEDPPQTGDPQASGFRGLTADEAEALQRRIAKTVLEHGVVESASVVALRSRIQGETAVLSMVPDGSTVKQGDLLMTLDDSALRDELLKQQITVQQAQAEVAAAKARLEAARQAATLEVPAAELKLRVAELARARYLDEGGELERDLARAECEIVIARERLKAVERQAASIQKEAGGNGPDNGATNLQKDLQNDPQNDAPIDLVPLLVREAEAQLEAALAAKQLLTRHVRPHETAALELGVLQAKAERQQCKSAAEAAQRKAESNLQVREAELDAEEGRLEDLQEQISRCRILAPRDGVVLHAAAGARRSTASKLEEGASVREGQLLLTMPDLERLRVRVGVHESQVGRVRVGQKVTLQLDAFPTREFTGRVAEISPTPEPPQWFNQEVVEYGVLVEVSAPPPGMKVGMTAAAEIDTAIDPSPRKSP